ncbi:MAG: ribosomal subunit interface protein, partial [Pseudomonadota bacterium]
MPHQSSSSPIEIDALFRDASISQKLYTDEAIFDLEMERLFGAAWILLGHECQITEPGAFFLGQIGKTSVIVVRDRDGSVRAL